MSITSMNSLVSSDEIAWRIASESMRLPNFPKSTNFGKTCGSRSETRLKPRFSRALWYGYSLLGVSPDRTPMILSTNLSPGVVILALSIDFEMCIEISLLAKNLPPTETFVNFSPCYIMFLMDPEMDSRFDFRKLEPKIYAKWEKSGFFNPDKLPARHKKPFTIIMPPPNANGSLHIGHALFVTLEDLMIRFWRMRGRKTLWLPISDHAGFETQVVVDKKLEKEGRNRFKIEREQLWKEMLVFTKENKKVMESQLRTLGASCDWSREKFTLDPDVILQTQKTFIQLYKDNLIYRGNRIVNWCVKHQTTLSELETKYVERKDPLFYIKYGPLTLATVRPETKFGDTALAVHPRDRRYAKYVGKILEVPSVEGTIRMKVVADEAVDPKFGTGVVKVTPAHDPADFEIGKRHGLEVRQVIGFDAKMNERAGRYAGLDRFECRKRIVEDMQRLGLMEKIEPYHHSVGVCYRCKTVVEPLVSTQWYVRTKPLAEPAIKAVRSGKIKIIPRGGTKTYYHWMENIRDWPVSRQLWWGHRIPAWYCDKDGSVHVSRTDLARCQTCGGPLRQDEDVLDTWFSSGLWPFSTLGWPKATADLAAFYPTSCLVTGFDILFFWVARMAMLGLKFMGEVPFREVYIHALVRDAEGKKMSKSRGNVIDPLVMIERYGADAFRFTLAAFAVQGRDIFLSEERIQGYRNFANKVWNALRFALMNLTDLCGQIEELKLADQHHMETEDRWIISRLNRVIGQVNMALEEYKFNEAASNIYQFFWHELCDWYLELIKPRLKQSTPSKLVAQQVMAFVLDKSLRLLHPFMPFITEELWQQLSVAGEGIMVAPFPKTQEAWIAPQIEEEMSFLMEVIGAIRNIRGELNIPPGCKIEVVLDPKEPGE